MVKPIFGPQPAQIQSKLLKGYLSFCFPLAFGASSSVVRSSFLKRWKLGGIPIETRQRRQPPTPVQAVGTSAQLRELEKTRRVASSFTFWWPIGLCFCCWVLGPYSLHTRLCGCLRKASSTARGANMCVFLRHVRACNSAESFVARLECSRCFENSRPF